MIEILILVQFCQRLAAIARQKGRRGTWGALGAVGWIGGEISGAVIAAKSNSNLETMNIYGFAILGAIIGSIIAYVIVKTLKERPLDPNWPTARVV